MYFFSFLQAEMRAAVFLAMEDQDRLEVMIPPDFLHTLEYLLLMFVFFVFRTKLHSSMKS